MRELSAIETREVSGGWAWIRVAFEVVSAAFILDDAGENIEKGFKQRKMEILAKRGQS